MYLYIHIGIAAVLAIKKNPCENIRWWLTNERILLDVDWLVGLI